MRISTLLILLAGCDEPGQAGRLPEDAQVDTDAAPVEDVLIDSTSEAQDAPESDSITEPCRQFIASWCDNAFQCFETGSWTEDQKWIVGFETIRNGSPAEEGFAHSDCVPRLLSGELWIETEGEFSSLLTCQPIVDYDQCLSQVATLSCAGWAGWIKLTEPWGSLLRACLND